jgi:hypothetical protein
MSPPTSLMVLFSALLRLTAGAEVPSSSESGQLPQVIPCPKATSSTAVWPSLENEDYGIAISAPLSYRRINFASRSDTTIASPFSLWKNAVTRVDFFSHRSYDADTVRDPAGHACVLRTEIGDLRVVIWRSIGKLYDGRDTTHFNARSEIRRAGKAIAVIRLSSLDSLTLLDNLQILQTIRRLKSVR